jgi:hypothetical protein
MFWSLYALVRAYGVLLIKRLVGSQVSGIKPHLSSFSYTLDTIVTKQTQFWDLKNMVGK